MPTNPDRDSTVKGAEARRSGGSAGNYPAPREPQAPQQGDWNAPVREQVAGTGSMKRDPNTRMGIYQSPGSYAEIVGKSVDEEGNILLGGIPKQGAGAGHLVVRKIGTITDPASGSTYSPSELITPEIEQEIKRFNAAREARDTTDLRNHEAKIKGMLLDVARDRQRYDAFNDIPAGIEGLDSDIVASGREAKSDIEGVGWEQVDEAREGFQGQMGEMEKALSNIQDSPLASEIAGKAAQERAQKQIMAQSSLQRGRYNPGMARAAMAESAGVLSGSAGDIAAAAAQEQNQRNQTILGGRESMAGMSLQSQDLERVVQAQRMAQAQMANEMFLNYLEFGLADKQFTWGAKMGYWGMEQGMDIAQLNAQTQMNLARMNQPETWEKVLNFAAPVVGGMASRAISGK